MITVGLLMEKLNMLPEDWPVNLEAKDVDRRELHGGKLESITIEFNPKGGQVTLSTEG